MAGTVEYIFTYLLCALGVLIGLLLPVLYGALPEVKVGSATYNAETLGQLKSLVGPLLTTTILSLIISILTAAIVLVASGGEVTYVGALLAGYASDATLQRLKKTPEPNR